MTRAMKREMNEMTSVLDLPPEITVDILLRLPVQTILSCKWVCTNWLQIISTLEFAKLHFSRAIPSLIVRTIGEKECKIFEFEDEVGLQHHDLHYKLMTEFNINTFCRTSLHSIEIMCSGSGLICLYDFYSNFHVRDRIEIDDESTDGVDDVYTSIDDVYTDEICVCNPITREFVHIPLIPEFSNDADIGKGCVTFGVGMSGLTGKFKVVRISQEDKKVSRPSDLKTECMVYTLGTHSWRSIEPNEVYYYERVECMYLNGNLHWLVTDAEESFKISCFDLETELFRSIPPPYISNSQSFQSGDSPSLPPGILQSFTVLDNCLCFCGPVLNYKVDIWIMKDYGVEGSWTREYAVNLCEPRDTHVRDMLFPDRFYALKVFKDGDILMFKNGGSLFYHRNNTRPNPRIRVFQPDDDDGWIEDYMLHTPSFVSLKSFTSENVTSF